MHFLEREMPLGGTWQSLGCQGCLDEKELAEVLAFFFSSTLPFLHSII